MPAPRVDEGGTAFKRAGDDEMRQPQGVPQVETMADGSSARRLRLLSLRRDACVHNSTQAKHAASTHVPTSRLSCLFERGVQPSSTAQHAASSAQQSRRASAHSSPACFLARICPHAACSFVRSVWSSGAHPGAIADCAAHPHPHPFILRESTPSSSFMLSLLSSLFRFCMRMVSSHTLRL